MDAVDILINEHVYIKKVLAAIRRDCEELVEGKSVDVEFYRKVIDFVRNFADKYHHQKEENKLFNIMAEKNETLKSGAIAGMLLEHDLGRMYIRNLEEALNNYEKGDKKQKAYIVANAISYTMLLEGHIDKEDNAIYMTARRVLDENIQERLKEEFEKIEGDQENTKIRNKYIDFANSL
ncbi:Hemerythrin HHE cation binding domain protein [Caloramator mitchellensis]|uniref:Hemerythrin HHE cation binding domain protein n=1 Tax=Caloramator mitchellensis TaxID=908809 RepID=A0A0R3JZ34_CALMK|nr:hemerythrin domain-containing protein [Caloramator mitchellensis]KRQ86404.1 Hemerythrin HHE cation binding domain protein [Caloramator mitchellensis]